MTRAPKPFDYDRSTVPDRYDSSRARSPEVMTRWMDAVAGEVRGRVGTIVDLGCGTGRFTGSLHDRFRSRVIGVDPSRNMLGRAQRKHEKTGLQFIVGHGEAIPLQDSSVDLVFMSMVFHHFVDPLRVARECHRVLSREGCVFLRAGSAERIPSYPITPFFPDAVPIMEHVLAPVAEICRTFEAAGFRTARAGLLEQQLAPTHDEYAAQLEADPGSVLARLDPQELEAGIRALRARAHELDPAPVRELIDYFSFIKST